MHAACAVLDWYIPVGHALHTEAAATEYRPTAQLVHALTPPEEYLPPAQLMHAAEVVAPAVGEYVPPKQYAQDPPVP